MAEFRLPRLPRSESIVDGAGKPLVALQRWWQSVVSKIEAQEATQDELLADMAAVQAEQAEMLVDIQTALTNAGIALDTANALMPDIPPVTIEADYTGVVLDGQLPRNIPATRYDGATDVTTSAAWSASTISGGATYTIGAATGVLNLSALTATTVVEVTSDHNSISRSRKVTITKLLQDPPPSSSSTTEYDSSITATSADTYGTENAGPLTLTCGASGEVVLAAPLSFSTSTVGVHDVYGKWQYRPSGGGAWTDVAVEIISDIAAQTTATESESGSISVSQTQTGLTASSDYEFQLLLRNASGSATIYYTGTASATTS